MFLRERVPVPPLPDSFLQCVDFAHWQRQWMQGAVLENELVHWRKTSLTRLRSIQLVC